MRQITTGDVAKFTGDFIGVDGKPPKKPDEGIFKKKFHINF